MEKILVTGGIGFIGNHLVNYLLSQGKEVIVLDKSIYKSTYYNIQSATIVEADVLSEKLLLHYLEKVDTCFHLAAIASVQACANDWIFAHENNVMGFNKLLDCISMLSHPIKLIYASSSAVYGDNPNLPLSESSHLYPCSMYAATKLTNEIYAKIMSEDYHVPCIGLRFFNVYGPGQPASSSYSGVISLFKNAINNHLPLTIYGDGKQTRDFIYIDDVIKALTLAALTPQKQSGIYNVCTGNAISIQELAELMIELSGKKGTIRHKKARTGDIYHSCGDAGLAEKELNFTAKTPLTEGLKNLLESHDD